MEIATAARQFATASGATFTLGAADDGGAEFIDSLEVSLGSGNTDGVTVLARVEYPDISINADWEVAEFTHNDAGTLVRVRTLISSSGTSAVTFTGSVIMFGVISHEQHRVKTGISVSKTSNQAISSNTATKVTFDTTAWDIKGEFSSSTYTAKADSRIRSSGYLRVAVASNEDNITIEQRVAGVAVAITFYRPSGTGTQSLYFNKVLEIDEGEALEIWFKNATNADSIEATTAHTFWEITDES